MRSSKILDEFMIFKEKIRRWLSLLIIALRFVLQKQRRREDVFKFGNANLIKEKKVL